MDDLISRQAAIDAVSCGCQEFRGIFARCEENLNALPSAERHGKWEYVVKKLARGGYVDASECSICHKRIMPHLKPNYCPNCGARMEERE